MWAKSSLFQHLLNLQKRKNMNLPIGLRKFLSRSVLEVQCCTYYNMVQPHNSKRTVVSKKKSTASKVKRTKYVLLWLPALQSSGVQVTIDSPGHRDSDRKHTECIWSTSTLWTHGKNILGCFDLDFFSFFRNFNMGSPSRSCSLRWASRSASSFDRARGLFISCIMLVTRSCSAAPWATLCKQTMHGTYFTTFVFNETKKLLL